MNKFVYLRRIIFKDYVFIQEQFTPETQIGTTQNNDDIFYCNIIRTLFLHKPDVFIFIWHLTILFTIRCIIIYKHC